MFIGQNGIPQRFTNLILERKNGFLIQLKSQTSSYSSHQCVIYRWLETLLLKVFGACLFLEAVIHLITFQNVANYFQNTKYSLRKHQWSTKELSSLRWVSASKTKRMEALTQYLCLEVMTETMIWNFVRCIVLERTCGDPFNLWTRRETVRVLSHSIRLSSHLVGITKMMDL